MGEQVTDTFEINDDLDNFGDGDIFGGLDSGLVGDPFAVDPNTYRCTVTDAEVVKFTDKETQEVSFLFTWKYTVDEPTSEFHGMTIQERHPIYPHLRKPGDSSQDLWNRYGPEEKRKTKFLKLRLRTSFDMTEEEINKVRPSQLIGREVYVTTVTGESRNPEDNRKFVNVKSTMSRTKYEEKNGVSSDDAALNASMDL